MQGSSGAPSAPGVPQPASTRLVFFHPLDQADTRKIVDLMLGSVAKRLSEG